MTRFKAMTSWFVVLSISAVLSCSGSSGTSAPDPVETPPAQPAAQSDLADRLDAYIDSYGKERGQAYRFSGYVHVVKADQVLYSKAFEYANRQTETVATPNTSFRIGSVTKQFTAAAIMLLEKQGKLALTDTIRKHLPSYPASSGGDKVTIHHLLTHTGGVPSYTNDEEVMKRRAQAMTTAELLATFKDKALDFEPGEEFEYSNSGYVILGAIIEKVAGSSYAEAMNKLVFEPAALTDTVVGDAPKARERALGYQTNPQGEVVPADPIDMSVPHAAGAIRSTALDLVRWHEVLEDGSVLRCGDAGAHAQDDRAEPVARRCARLRLWMDGRQGFEDRPHRHSSRRRHRWLLDVVCARARR